MDIRKLIEKIVKEKEKEGGIKNVVWIAAGGSYGGNYPAQYFMTSEATKINSQMFTSNEFVFAPPKYVNENTLAVICSMRGTAETCEAAQVAKNLGATTIGIYVDESRLTKICDYIIQYESIAWDHANQGNTNAAVILKIAMNLLDIVEGYDHYKDAMDAFDLIDPIYRDAVDYATPLAQKWAEENKNEKCITVMGSGPAYASAYIFSICNVMEMLQIQSPTVNCCEYFHGPFEVLDKNTSVFLLVSEGRVRPADERAIKFLKQYGGEKVYILDAKELGINRLKDSVCEYFNHFIFAPVLNNVYMRKLSEAIKVDYTTRRYMWKVEY